MRKILSITRCQDSAKSTFFVGLVFLFGCYGSFAQGRSLVSDVGGTSGAGVLDGIVNFQDLAVLANEWLDSNSESYQLKADFNGDGITDFGDLEVMLNEWLETVPVAFIDSITPNPADLYVPVTFTGHGNEEFVTITAYQWKIDDVNVSNEATFTTSTIAQGIHSVSFAVEDDAGEWSEPATKTLAITGMKPSGSHDSTVDFLEDFDDLAEGGWSVEGAQLSQEYEIVLTGSASIRLTKQSGGTLSITKDYGEGNGINFQYHNMLLQYYVDPNRAAKMDAINSCVKVYLYSDNGDDNRAVVGFLPHAAGWNTIDLCPSQFGIYGDFNWTNVQRFTISVNAPSSGLYVVLDRFEAWPTHVTNGAVMFTFDDGFLGSLTGGIRYLATKGYRSIWYISGERIGPDTYASGMKIADWPDVAEANSLGCLIATHCLSAMPVNDVNRLRNWCATQKQYLINHGYTKGADYFAIPGGQKLWNGSLTPQQCYDTLREYFVHIRGTQPYWQNAPLYGAMGSTAPSSRKPKDAHWGSPVYLTSDFSKNKRAVDTAKLNRDVLVFIMHDVEKDVLLGLDPNVFRATVDYVESQGLDVITYEDMLNGR